MQNQPRMPGPAGRVAGYNCEIFKMDQDFLIDIVNKILHIYSTHACTYKSKVQRGKDRSKIDSEPAYIVRTNVLTLIRDRSKLDHQPRSREVVFLYR